MGNSPSSSSPQGGGGKRQPPPVQVVVTEDVMDRWRELELKDRRMRKVEEEIIKDDDNPGGGGGGDLDFWKNQEGLLLDFGRVKGPPPVDVDTFIVPKFLEEEEVPNKMGLSRMVELSKKYWRESKDPEVTYNFNLLRDEETKKKLIRSAQESSPSSDKDPGPEEEEDHSPSPHHIMLTNEWMSNLEDAVNSSVTRLNQDLDSLLQKLGNVEAQPEAQAPPPPNPSYTEFYKKVLDCYEKNKEYTFNCRDVVKEFAKACKNKNHKEA